MVKEIVKNNKKYYSCNLCKLVYKNIDIAKKCEEWCSIHGACSLEITKHAVKT